MDPQPVITPPPPPRRRRGLVWLALGAGVVLLAGGALTVWLGTRPPAHHDHGPLPISDTQDHCYDNGRQSIITIYFNPPDPDPAARAEAEKLRTDQRISALGFEDQQHAFERFKVIFKDQPELVKLTRPEALPASVWVHPSDLISLDELTDQLRRELPSAEIKPITCPPA